MIKKFLLMPGFLILSMLVIDAGTESFPQINWQICIGGTGDENILYMIKLKDGNFLYCGFTDSHNGDFDAKNGGSDAFLVKTDASGNVIWKNIYGGSRDEVFYNVIEATNGDIIALGTSGSNDKQVTNHHGTPGTDDIWLVKTNNNGNLIKERCFGGSGSESTFEIGMSEGLMIDHNGDILLAGESNSNDGDVAGNHGDYDAWIIKLNPATFDIIKTKTIGSPAFDAAYNIFEINGDLFITGCKSTVPFTTTDSNTLEDHGDGFAARLNLTTLEIIWYKTYGGSGSEYCNAAAVSHDGNLVLTGHAASTDGDCVGNSGFNTWTWKIKAADGSILWKSFIGTTGDTSSAFNMKATSDNGFIVVGGIARRLSRNSFDAYAIKFNSEGDTLWTKRFGGSSNDQLLAVAEENNKNILVAGLTSSKDINGYHAGPVNPLPPEKRKDPTSDAWMVKLTE